MEQIAIKNSEGIIDLDWHTANYRNGIPKELELIESAHKTWLKFYRKKVSSEIFSRVAYGDPEASMQRPDSRIKKVGPFTKWICNLDINEINLILSGEEDLAKAYSSFQLIKSHLPQNARDINLYKSVTEFRKIVTEALKTIETKSMKKHRALDGAEIISSTDSIDVIHPLTREAAIAYSRRALWCTSHSKNAEAYFQYNSEDTKLYILHFKKNGKIVNKKQLSIGYETMYCDIKNKSIPVDIKSREEKKAINAAIDDAFEKLGILDIVNSNCKYLLLPSIMSKPVGNLLVSTQFDREKQTKADPRHYIRNSLLKSKKLDRNALFNHYMGVRLHLNTFTEGVLKEIQKPGAKWLTPPRKILMPEFVISSSGKYSKSIINGMLEKFDFGVLGSFYPSYRNEGKYSPERSKRTTFVKLTEACIKYGIETNRNFSVTNSLISKFEDYRLSDELTACINNVIINYASRRTAKILHGRTDFNSIFVHCKAVFSNEQSYEKSIFNGRETIKTKYLILDTLIDRYYAMKATKNKASIFHSIECDYLIFVDSHNTFEYLELVTNALKNVRINKACCALLNTSSHHEHQAENRIRKIGKVNGEPIGIMKVKHLENYNQYAERDAGNYFLKWQDCVGNVQTPFILDHIEGRN